MLELRAIVWGVQDVARALAFWSAALDYEVSSHPDETWAILKPREGRSGPQLSLKLVHSPQARRHHMDLFTHDQAAEVERLIALGARRVPDWRYDPNADYVVLKDPDGNPFCVCQLAEDE